MTIYIVIEVSEVRDVESTEATNVLDIVTDTMKDVPYVWYVDEVLSL